MWQFPELQNPADDIILHSFMNMFTGLLLLRKVFKEWYTNHVYSDRSFTGGISVVREAVDRILEGNFNNDVHSLNFSSPLIELNLEPGEKYEGSFTIYGKPNVMTEGTVSTTELRMKCLAEHFTGSEEEIPYVFDAAGMTQGDSLKGEFRVISNQGEYLIPYHVEISNGNLNSSLGSIRNLFHFTNLAKTNWEEAVNLFFSRDFEQILQGSDRQYLNIYRGLVKNDRKEQYLEEFLLQIKKKQQIEYIIENQDIRIEDPQGVTEGRVVIQQNGWGYSRLYVQTEGDFLSVEKEIIREEDFLGNCCRFSFYVDEAKLHAGKNYGKIRFTNAYTSQEVTVMAYNQCVSRKLTEVNRKKKHAIVELMQYYEAFRTKKISASSWMNETSLIMDRLQELDDQNPAYMLMRVQLLITQERTNEAEWLLGQADDLLAGNYDPTLYCYYMYLSTLLNRTEDYIDEMAEQVEKIFKENMDDWRIAWLLIYLSGDYSRSPSRKWLVLEEQFAKGATSPVLYIEAYHLIQSNPSILMQLGAFEIQVLYYAARKQLLTAEVVEQIVYLAKKLKGFRKQLYQILCACYQILPNDDVLQTICTVLINGNTTDQEAHSWYEKGIEKELRITRLYEYYMMSLELKDDVVIPKMVLMYFAFDSSLDGLHNSFLYAYVYRNKAAFPELYESYKEHLEQFVVFQILKKKNNKWLAYLYKNLVTEGMITEEVSEGLVTAVFLQELHLKRKNISRVCVVYDSLKEEQNFPVAGQDLSIPLYGSNYRIILEDFDGNRFCREEEYELRRLMIPDKIAGMIAPYVKDEILFDLWLCEKGHQLLAVNENNKEHMKQIMESLLVKENLQKDVRLKLMQYYYDHDQMNELDECLNELSPEMIYQDSISQMVRFMVIRGMYEKAYDWIRLCGGEGIEAKIIVRLCGRLLSLDGMKEDAVMTALIHRAYLSGKYDEVLLSYLSLYFQGTVKEMRDIWETAESFGVDTRMLEERILIQILYTGAYVGNAAAIFLSYVKKGADPSVELAFLSQSCYDYFVRDKVTDPFILKEVERLTGEENEIPFVCKLAYTKYYAEHKEQTDEKISRNLLVFLREMVSAKMVFPFYKEYAENITFMQKYMDKTMVEYHVHEGNRAIIHYLIEREGNVENEYHKEEMQNMYGGVCVKEFVLFFGERLQYYVVEVEEDQEQLTESGTFSRSDTDTNQKISRYNLINDIAMARTLKDYDTMEKMLFEYYDYSYLLNELFSMK